jgi:hypothetical protein
MRVLLKATLPNGPFNDYVRDGSAKKKLNKVIADVAPETVYFTEFQGQRTVLAVVEIHDASRIPAIAEPFFLVFDARVEFRVVMTSDDLDKVDLEEIGKKWG